VPRGGLRPAQGAWPKAEPDDIATSALRRVAQAPESRAAAAGQRGRTCGNSVW
jgi:hypothetical protein